MSRIIHAGVSRLCACLAVLLLVPSSSTGTAAEVDIVRAVDCSHNENDWNCFGELDTGIYISGRDERVLIARLGVQRFSNDEMRAEREVILHGTKPAQRMLSSYFSVMPSGVKLFRDWEKLGAELAFFENAQTGHLDALKAAFPDGPNSISDKVQNSSGTVKRKVPRLGIQDWPVAVIAWRTEDGVIRFQYRDYEKSIEVHEVLGSWISRRPDPLPDDHSLTRMPNNVGRQFNSLGEARKFAPKP